MASNLSTIGYAFADEDTFRDTMVACAGATSKGLNCAAGSYGIWSSRSGAEIWFHLSTPGAGETEIYGLTPFFEGVSDVAMSITAAIHRPGDNPFEGAFHGWVTPTADGEGAYPLVFDAVDFAARQDATWPENRHVRLTAFAREVAAYDTPESYFAARNGDDDIGLAAQAFLPIGLFAAAEEAAAQSATGETAEPAPPSSSALLTGRVAEHSVLTNEASGRPFHWLLVETLEAVIDVVADPDVVKGDIVQGGTVEVSAVLFGRFLD